MSITNKAKDEIEHRLQSVENFIADKGVGSSYLTRAKKVQRNINIALVASGVIGLIGLATWLFSGDDDEE